MPARKSIPVPIPIPVGGVDRSTNADQQPAGTCPDALNVVDFPAPADCLTVGKRSGLAKALTTAAGSGSRGLHIDWAEKAAVPAVTTNGTLVPRVDDLGAYDLAGANDTRMNLSGAYVAAYKTPSGTAVRCLTDDQLRGYKSAGIAPQHLRILPPTSSADITKELIFASAYPTGNDMEVNMTSAPGISATGTNARWNPTYVGPFIRGADDLSSRLAAYLEWTGVDQYVRLVVVQMGSAGVLRLTQSSAVRLRGFIGANVDPADLRPDLKIRIYEDKVAAQVKATCTWPGAISGGGDLSLSVTYATTFNSTSTRGGLVYRTSQLDITGYSQSNFARFVRFLTYSRREPYSYASVKRVFAAEESPDPGGDAFVLPDGIRSSQATLTAATPTTVLGYQHYAATQTFPTLDTTNDIIVATNNFTRGSNQYMQTYESDPGSAVWAVDLSYRRINTGRDDLNPIFRATADHKWFIRVELNRTIDTNTRDYSVSEYTSLIIRVCYDNAGTRAQVALETIDFTAGGLVAPVFSIGDSPVRWSYESGTLYLRQNGITLWSYAVTGDAQWTGAVATTAYGPYVGADCSNASGATVSQARGWEVTNLSPTLAAAVPYKRRLLVFTSNLVEVGELGGALSACTGGGHTGGEPVGASIGGKYYSVDGVTSKVTDLDTLAVNPWPNVAGTALDNCTACCEFRGRALIGGPGATGYGSRRGNPVDFDTGADVASTRAFAFSDPEIGQVGDNIVALASYKEDFVFIGCARSFYLMNGDPGAGGRIEPMRCKVGIAGPRAWCFSDTGDFYFMGQSGLCVIPQGDRIEVVRVSAQRISDLLERVDYSGLRILLTFDNLKRWVHIFLTPTDGTVGTHLIYSVSRNALWPAKYPLRQQPFAACQISGVTDEDRRTLIVGDDGWVRRFLDTAYGDDGEDVETLLRMAAIADPSGGRETDVSILAASGHAGSGPVSWAWLVANSSQELAAMAVSDAVASGTWFGSGTGAQQAASIGMIAMAHQLVLRQTSRVAGWAISNIMAEMRPGGQRRIL